MFRLLLTATSLAFVIAGCPAPPDAMTDPNDSSLEPNDTTTEPNTPNDSRFNVNLVEATAKVSVALPDGVAGDGLLSWTSLGEAPIAGAAADVMFLEGGPQLATVLDPQKNVVLMGWIDPSRGKTALSARTTAEVMAYFDVGGWLLSADLRQELVTRLESEPAVDALAAEITTLLAAEPHNLSADPAALDAARLALRDVLLADKNLTSAIRVQPGNAQSGIMVNQTGLDTIFLTNSYRRRAVAFVDLLTPSEELFREVSLSPTAGATSVFGVLTDLARGTVAWAPVDSDPLQLPLVPEDADRTEYRVTVVGMGAFAGVEASLNQSQLERLNETVVKTVLVDFFIPLLANVILPLNGDAIDDYLSVANGNSVVSTFASTVGNTAPGVWEKSAQGDLSGAMADLWNAFASDGTVRLAAFDMILQLFLRNASADDRAAFQSQAQNVANILGRVDMVLTAVDSSVQVAHLAASSRAVQFDVTVNRSQVNLTPERTEVTYGETATFTASVPSATGDNAPGLTYEWSIPGTFGVLSDSAGHSGTSFESSRSVVTYRPNAPATGEETLSVKAYEIVGQERRFIGEATALVRVRQARVEITPRRTALGRGDVEIFHAIVPEELGAAADSLTYIWTTSGQYGGFRSGVNNFETDEDVQPWLVTTFEEGTDTVTVEAFGDVEGQRISLGSATAEILVEQGRKSIIFGSAEYRTEPASDAATTGRSCISSHMIIPKRDGATNYRIYAYGFNDPLFFGTSTTDNIDPENVRVRDGGGKNTPQVDEGGHWAIGLSGGCGPNPDMGQLMSRFAGMIVEIEVTYDE